MANTIPQSFVTVFEQQVTHDYQLAGGQLRDCTRVRQVSNAETAKFHRLGAGVASQKSRHGDLVMMNLAHSIEQVSVVPWFANELIDDVDEFRTNASFRGEYMSAIKAALARKEDEIILDAWVAAAAAQAGGAGVLDLSAAALSTEGMLEAITTMKERNVAADNLKFVIGEDTHAQLTYFPEFASADYAETKHIPGMARRFNWYGAEFFVYNGLPLSVADRSCFVVDKSNTVLAMNTDISVRIDWVAMKRSNLLSGELMIGAKAIQDDGVLEVTTLEVTVGT